MPNPSETSTPAASMTPRMFCRKCGYALIGLESRICPECGRGFYPGNRRTFAARQPRGWVWRWGRRVLALVLLLVLAAGVGMGWLWWGWHAEQPTIARLDALHQQFSVAPIGPERLRWMLGRRLGYLAERVDRVHLESLGAGDTEQLDFGSLAHMKVLELVDCDLGNFSFSHLRGLKKLQALTLWHLEIQKPNLAFLEELPALADLRLSGLWVGEAGFEHIGRLKHLKRLNLEQAGMKDSDLQQLKGLSSLEELYLTYNPISYTALEHLQALRSLRVLDVGIGWVDLPVVARLKKSIPGLLVR